MTDVLNVSPTRSQLLEVKNKATLARKGHSLLKKKQDVLINELFARVKDYKDKKKDISEKVRRSYKSLALDIAYTGVFMSRSASYSSPEYFDINFEFRNLMGLKLPSIQAKHTEKVSANGYAISPQLAEARKNFHELFEHLLELSSMELSIRVLAEEIKKIKRRVNSLEHIQIPRLDNTVKMIRFVLDEQERDNFIRLKTIKKRMGEGTEY